MAAAVVQLQEAKSTPDITRISAMSSRTVMVTRVFAKNIPGEVLVTEENVSVDRVLALYRSEVTKTFGAGTYRFEVVDVAGQERDIWTCRYGAEQQPGVPLQPSLSSVPYDGSVAGVQDLGGGYRYNPSLGVISGPKGMFRWQPGDALPAELQPVSAQVGGVTPIHPGLQPWGTMPAFGGQSVEDPRVKALEETLRQQQVTEMQREHQRAIDKLMDGFQKAQEATNARIEGLMQKIVDLQTRSATPTGPNPELEALKLQIAQANERAERAEQRAREEAMSTSHRADIARLEQMIQAFMNKPAPDTMAPLLTAMITQSQAASASAVEAVRDASAQATTKLAEAAMTPDRMAVIIGQLTQQMQGQGQGFNGMMMEAFSKMMGLQHKLTTQQIELERAGQGPSWMPLLEHGVETVGQVARALATRPAAAPVQQVRPAQAQVRRLPPQPQQQRLPAAPAQPAAAPAPAKPAKPLTERERNIAQRDRMAAEMAAKEAAARAAAAPPPAATPPAAAPAEPTADRKPPGRRRKMVAPIPAAAAPGAAAPQMVEQGGEAPPSNVFPLVPPAPAAPPEIVKPTLAQMAAIPVEAMREVIAQIPDEPYELDGQPQLGFWGSLLDRVNELRAHVTMLDADQIAGYMIQGREYLQGAGEYPPCLEMMAAGHFLIVCERLLPEAAPEFVADVAAKTQVLWMAPPEVEKEDGDEEEEEGEEDDDPTPTPAAS